MQKEILVGVTLLILSGCVNNQLTAGEMAICLSATQTQLSTIPLCMTPSTCHTEWEKRAAVPSFHFLAVGGSAYQTQNTVEKTWESLNRAQVLLQKTNSECEKGNPFPILENGFASTGYLHHALKSSEESYVHAFELLRRSAESAHSMDLTLIKDEKAYDYYTQILTILQSTATGQSSSEMAQRVEENQAYYEKIGKLISQNPTPGYTPNVGETAKWYETGTTIAAPEQKKTILWFSVAWKSMLTSLTNSKNWEKNLYLLQHLEADALTQNISMIVAPKNGVVIEMVHLASELEKEIQRLHSMEEKELNGLTERVHVLQEQKVSNESVAVETVNALAPYFEAYSVSLPPFHTIIDKQSTHLDAIENTIEELWDGRVNKSISLGKRITTRRLLEKKVWEEEDKLNEKEEVFRTLDKACHLLAEKALPVNENGIEDCETLLHMLESQKETLELTPLIQKSKIEWCVNEINIILNAMQEETETWSVEQYVLDFGEEAAIPACESQLAALKNEYSHAPLSLELNTLLEKTMDYYEGITNAQSIIPGIFSENIETVLGETEKALENTERWLSPTQQMDSITILEKLNEQLSEEIRMGFQQYANQKEWEVIEPLPIESGVEVEAEAHLTIPNPFGKNVTIEGEIQIAKPVSVMEVTDSVAAMVEFESNTILLSEITLTESGITIIGKGKGVWIDASTQTKIVHLYGTTSVQKTIATLERKSEPVISMWSWNPPSGVDVSQIRVHHNNQLLNYQLSGKKIAGIIKLSNKKEEITFEYERKDSVKVQTTIISEQEDELTQTTTYQIIFLSNEDQSLITNLSIGVLAPPAETKSMIAFDENGKPHVLEQGALSEIIIPNVEIQPHATREFMLVITRDAEIGLSSAVAIIIEELNALVTHSDAAIAAETIKLLHEIQQNNSAATLPAMVQKVEALIAKAHESENQLFGTNAEWKKAMDHWAQNPSDWSDIEKELIERGMNAQSKGDWRTLENTLVELQKQDHEMGTKETANKSENGPNEFIERIQGTITQLGELDEVVKTYESSLGISCDKLREVGYFCPITEGGAREVKRVNKEARTELEQQLKRAQKENTEKVKLEIDSEKRMVLESQIKKSAIEIENAHNSIRETAEALVKEIQTAIESKGSTEEVQTALKKASDALESKQYGKSIFIAKNVWNYLQGENRISGLFNVPLVTWPLIGIIVIAGSVFGYRTWRKKQTKTPEPKILPRSLTNVNQASVLNDNGEPVLLHTQGERPLKGTKKA